jgi:hypothetical protein
MTKGIQMKSMSVSVDVPFRSWLLLARGAVVQVGSNVRQ